MTHDEGGKEASPVVEDLIHWTMTLTLHVLSGAAFSLHMPWPTRSISSPNLPWKTAKADASENKSTTAQKHKMSFQHTVDSVLNYLPFIIFFPSWLLRNSPLSIMKDMQLSSDEFNGHMKELIEDNEQFLNANGGDMKQDINTSRNDLLSNIVKASSADKKQALSNQEMVGNIFIFILAGHETTANTLQSALIILATKPKIQQTVQNEIDSIWASKKTGEDLTYDDYPNMRAIMALMVFCLTLYLR